MDRASSVAIRKQQHPTKPYTKCIKNWAKKPKVVFIFFQRGRRGLLLFPYFVYLQINGMTDSWILKAITVYLDWGCQVKTVIWNLKVCLAWCTCLTKSKNPGRHKLNFCLFERMYGHKIVVILLICTNIFSYFKSVFF